MPGSSSVPQPTFGNKGFIPPDEADVLAGVQADQNAAFGGNLNPGLSTPQGQLATSETAEIGNKNDQFVFLSQQFDPAYASGRYQDALGRIYFMERNPAQPTSVLANAIGAAGTLIPAGSFAQATDGNLYISLADATIPVGGSIAIEFACAVTGPIPCPAGSLNAIYRLVPGWDTISNPTDGVIGADVEGRADFEFRRQASVALNSLGGLPAIKANVLAVPNVLDAYVIDNTSSSSATIGGVTLVAKSVYVCVAGGDPLAVATAIWQKKAPGCAYNGSTTVTVTDSGSGYAIPYPTYQVKFQIAAGVSTLLKVTLANNPGIPSNALALIQAAIIDAFSGGDGGPRARIGGTQFASRYYQPVQLLGAWAEILQIQIGSADIPSSTFTGVIATTILTASGSIAGTIAVGQFLSGPNIAAGTKIISLGTGSGGAGTYNVNISQTAASGAVVGAVAASNSFTPDIDEIPTIAAPYITLALV